MSGPWQSRDVRSDQGSPLSKRLPAPARCRERTRRGTPTRAWTSRRPGIAPAAPPDGISTRQVSSGQDVSSRAARTSLGSGENATTVSREDRKVGARGRAELRPMSEAHAGEEPVLVQDAR
jgi:hypothetical protein